MMAFTRLLIELNKTWVLVKIDLRNAFNEIMRAVVLGRLNAVRTGAGAF